MPYGGPDPLEQTLRSVMSRKQGNGYDPAEVADTNIMADEAKYEAQTLLKFYSNPAEALEVLRERMQRVQDARNQIRQGTPEAFGAETGTNNFPDVGYYGSKNGEKYLIAPGSEKWNPNEAVANLAIREHVFGAAIASLEKSLGQGQSSAAPPR